MNIAENAGKMLSELIPEIIKTKEFVQGIARSSEIQNQSAKRINKSVKDLDAMVQNNAASAEEMSSSSETFAYQAMNLKEIVGFFKVQDTAPIKNDSRPSTMMLKKPAGVINKAKNLLINEDD